MTQPSARWPRWYRTQLASLQPELPQALADFRTPRTDPSPNRALTTPGWADPNPNSAGRPIPPAESNIHCGRSSVSDSSGSQLPISRMFGQSELWTQPGKSHQSQLPDRPALAQTDFSMMAIVFDSPSVTDAG